MANIAKSLAASPIAMIGSPSTWRSAIAARSPAALSHPVGVSAIEPLLVITLRRLPTRSRTSVTNASELVGAPITT
jgi:hypothetical protein